MKLTGHFYPWVWVAFALWFMVWEGLAIGTGNNKWTLSDYVWRLEDIGAGWSALRYLVAVACLWLFFHLAFGWFRLPARPPRSPARANAQSHGQARAGPIPRPTRTSTSKTAGRTSTRTRPTPPTPPRRRPPAPLTGHERARSPGGRTRSSSTRRAASCTSNPPTRASWPPSTTPRTVTSS